MSTENNAEVIVLPSECHTDLFYWRILKTMPKREKRTYFFTTDEVRIIQDFAYSPYASDFGPLSLSQIYRYCIQLQALLQTPIARKRQIVHYCAGPPNKVTNSALLIGCFMMLVLEKSAEDTISLFSSITVLSYRDASQGPCVYPCTLEHCFKALEFALKLGWFKFADFNCKEYDYYSRLENGDMNWIIPNKMLAFSCPAQAARDQEGWRQFTPENYVPLFRKWGISAVVRLSAKTYDGERFRRNGMKLHELYFLDGGCPSDFVIKTFFELAETETGLAVHCKAGLGRTGTLIGCYAISVYKFPAPEFIAWCRMSRPGSVLGPQQQFLLDYERRVNSQLSAIPSKFAATVDKEDGRKSKQTLHKRTGSGMSRSTLSSPLPLHSPTVIRTGYVLGPLRSGRMSNNNRPQTAKDKGSFRFRDMTYDGR